MKPMSFHLACWTVTLCLAATAQAATPPGAASQPVSLAPGVLNDPGNNLPQPDLTPYQGQIDQMKQLQRDTLESTLRLQLLKQQLDEAKTRDDLAKLNGQAKRGVPYVMSLFGVAGARQARLMVPGFGVVTARAGTLLPNQWRVVSVSEQAVLVRRGRGARVQLPFYSPGA